MHPGTIGRNHSDLISLKIGFEFNTLRTGDMCNDYVANSMRRSDVRDTSDISLLQ